MVDVVIAIARGGRETSSRLARALGVPNYEIVARHNTSDDPWSGTFKSVDVESPTIPATDIKGHILLVDDICGSGQTLRAVREVLAGVGARYMTSVTLCRNEGSDLCPDLWLWTVRDWVVFPWEPLPPGLTTETLRCPIVVSFRDGTTSTQSQVEPWS